MDNFLSIPLQDCPLCSGPALLEEEQGWCFYVTCLDCGCHTAEVEYRSADQREAAARATAELWAHGKVISSNPGE